MRRAAGGAGRACPPLVGVFVNEVVGKISITMEKVGLNFAQLSGDVGRDAARTAWHWLQGIRPRSQAEALDDAAYFRQFAAINERIPSLLIDAYHPQLYGGTGEQASVVAVAVREKTPRLMLAGGPTPENVAVARSRRSSLGRGCRQRRRGRATGGAGRGEGGVYKRWFVRRESNE
ncbi:MAG: hypothetical protein U0521_29415 [Anaerolineae bacterium]